MLSYIAIPNKPVMNKDDTKATTTNRDSHIPHFDLEPSRVFAPGSSATVVSGASRTAEDAEMLPAWYSGDETESNRTEAKSDTNSSLQGESKSEPINPSSNSASIKKAPPVTFPSTYRLRPSDIICGRNKFALNQTGNRRFRVLISSYLQRYFRSESRGARYLMNNEIIETIQNCGGYFLKQASSGEWVEISEKEKRNKVGHALRDAAATFRANEISRQRNEARRDTPPPPPPPIAHSSDLLQGLIDFDESTFPHGMSSSR